MSIAPSCNDTGLVFTMEKPIIYNTYEQAEQTAKGWSQKKENGPGMIFLAESEKDPNAAFLCQFFDGELVSNDDKLEQVYNIIKKDLEGGALLNANKKVQQNQVKNSASNAVNNGDTETAEDKA